MHNCTRQIYMKIEGGEGKKKKRKSELVIIIILEQTFLDRLTGVLSKLFDALPLLTLLRFPDGVACHESEGETNN